MFELSAAQQLGMPRSGLLLILLTRYDFKEVVGGNRPALGIALSNSRVDNFSMMSGLQISYYTGDEANWKEALSSNTPISLRVGPN